jgi:dienelactone hydrolase
VRAVERSKRGLIVVAAGLVGVLAFGGSAQAAVPATLHDAPACATKDAADGETTIDTEMTFVFCDDGVPGTGFPGIGPGGAVANATGASAVTVPAKYGTGAATFAGLPAKDITPPLMPGADASGDVALDVDVTLPGTAPPAGGYPMIVMMHGCCGGNKGSWEANTIDQAGERWHYSNAWFASRGYVVVTYTARGFVSAASTVPGQPNRAGSTGETQLDSRSFEINDYQALACNILDASEDQSFDDVSPLTDTAGVDVKINPDKVVTTGGSYGGGFSWLSLTDPEWTCNADTGADTTPMSLAATAPRYGWTDLAYTLVPNGTHSVQGGPSGDLPAFDGCDSGGRDIDEAVCSSPAPTGVPKTSIVTGLYLSGTLVNNSHTSFSPEITDAFTCLQGTYPLEANPACSTTLSTTLPRFLRERSAYYQNDWFTAMPSDPDLQVPIFNAGTLTDPLFPMYENRRMANRILDVKPDYPIKQYYGDYLHFVQNKAKEWGDLCTTTGDRHVCTLADYPGGVNAGPSNPVDPGTTQAGLGVTTRLNKFIDNYATPTGGYTPAPGNVTPDVTTSLQVCPDNAAGLGVAADEPGPRFTSSAFEGLAPNSLTVEMAGAQTTNSTATNGHATNADPVANSAFNGGRCPRETTVAPPGAASYTSEALSSAATMIGATEVTARFLTPITGSAEGLQLNARLYDVLPDGTTSLMADRGPSRVTTAQAAAGEVTWELHGNGWRFQTGHRIRIELSQDDQPFMKATTVTSSLSLTGADLLIPTVESFGTDIPGTPDPKPTTSTTLTSPPATSAPAPKKCKKGFKLKKGKCKKKKKKK